MGATLSIIETNRRRRKRLIVAFVVLATGLIAALSGGRLIPGSTENKAGMAFSVQPVNRLSLEAAMAAYRNRAITKTAALLAPAPGGVAPGGVAPGGVEPVKAFLARLGEDPEALALGEPEPLAFPFDEPLTPMSDIGKKRRTIGSPDDVPPELPLPEFPIDRPSPDTITVPTLVPEPSTWAFLITGFGLVGMLLRRRARRSMIPA